jgi:hypothetical protein
MQVEFATDVLFPQQGEFPPLYEAIIRTAVQSIKADHVATFLGRKLTTTYHDEVGNDFSTRIQGTRIHNQMGPASIKLYDKAGIMARMECTTNDASFFKFHQWALVTLMDIALFDLATGGVAAVRADIAVWPTQSIQRLTALVFVAIAFEKFMQTQTLLELIRILCHAGILCVFRQFQYPRPSGSLAEPQG